MPKKSALTETHCLIASLSPVMFAHKDSIYDEAKTIEALYRYTVELYDGIARNSANEFCGKFDFSVCLSPDHFLIYKKTEGTVVSEKEYEEFMTALSILEMVFIDENIYLTGYIDERNIYVSKEGIIWGIELDCAKNESKIRVSISDGLGKQFEGKYTTKIGGTTILDFLPTVYRFSPFKEEKGNMMRHIVIPINNVRSSNEEALAVLIAYCRRYILNKGFDLSM